MDEFKILFWIIVAVVYILTRTRKKQKSQQPLPTEPEGREEQAPRPVSFEELLREIQASKSPAPPAKPEPPATPAYKSVPPQRPAQPREYQDYDDEIEPDEKDLEDTQFDYKKKDEIYDVYEKAKNEAFVKSSLEETLKLEDTQVKFGQFKEYEQVEVNTRARDILKEFNDPEGFKKAFIMSEVLKRKF